MPNSYRLVVGLGNPGADYVSTRHNIGFMALDAIAGHYRLAPWKRKFKGELTGSDVLFLKPLTFMNLSGESVGEALRFHKIPSTQVVVFHDDLDLLPGQVKAKQGGGTGGHNGLKSLDAHIGQDYWRVRLGIGHPGIRGDAVTDYVLGGFSKADASWLPSLLDKSASCFEQLVSGNIHDYARAIEVKDASSSPGS